MSGNSSITNSLLWTVRILLALWIVLTVGIKLILRLAIAGAVTITAIAIGLAGALLLAVLGSLAGGERAPLVPEWCLADMTAGAANR